MSKHKFNFRLSRKQFAFPYLLFLILFIIVPLLLIVGYAFTDKDGNITFANFINFFSEKTNLDVFFTSVLISLGNTIFCLLLGFPIAYFLASKKYNKNTVLIVLFIMPMWINFVLRTGAARDLLFWMGLDGGSHPILMTMIGMVYNYLPFAILPLYATMLKMDKNLLEASTDLGATSFQTFYKVVIPSALPGIVSACTMVFMPTMSSYVIADVMSERKLTIIGNLIDTQFSLNMWNAGSAVSLILLLIIGISMIFTRNVEKQENARGGIW